MGHRLQRRQAEPFVQRRENKDLGGIVKSAQHFDGHKSQEAHIVLHAAADHRPPQVGIAGNVVSNDDELQIGICLVFFQLRLQRGEGFDHAHDILVRTDSSGIKQKGIRDLIALGNQLAVGGAGVPVKEPLIDRVVDHLDAPRGNAEQLLHLDLGKV